MNSMKGKIGGDREGVVIIIIKQSVDHMEITRTEKENDDSLQPRIQI